jgi:hypothetical protein
MHFIFDKNDEEEVRYQIKTLKFSHLKSSKKTVSYQSVPN